MTPAPSAAKLPPMRRDWLSKTLAGVLLGFTLAMLCSGVFDALAAGMGTSIRGQIAMWMVPPISLAVLGGCYLFASGKRTWLWLSAANVLALGLLTAARLL